MAFYTARGARMGVDVYRAILIFIFAFTAVFCKLNSYNTRRDGDNTISQNHDHRGNKLSYSSLPR